MRTVTTIYMTCLVLLLVCCSSANKLENMQMESNKMEHNTMVSMLQHQSGIRIIRHIEFLILD